MPNLSIAIPETESSILRPIVLDIVNYVGNITGLAGETEILFPNESEHIPKSGSTLDNPSTNPRLETNKLLKVRVKETYDENSLLTTDMRQQNTIPIFGDSNTKTFLRAEYSPNTLEIQFEYSTNSKTEALQWRDMMRLRASQYYSGNIHTLDYHYVIPSVAFQILSIIHLHRERVEGYRQTFVDYIQKHCINRVRPINDSTGVFSSLCVVETQGRREGFFDFDTYPEQIEKGDHLGIWKINFNYKVTYHKPIAVNLIYPVMVHNKLIPEFLINLNDPINDPRNKSLQATNTSVDAFNYFESSNQLYRYNNIDKFFRVPRYDESELKFEPLGIAPIVIALIEVDERDKVSLLNLDELGDICIDLDVMTFIKESEYPFICNRYKSILQLNLLLDNQTYIDALSCDINGYVKALNPLSLRNIHRVKLGLVTDLSLLDPDALERLRKYPNALNKIIESLNHIYRNFSGIKELGMDGYFSPIMFDRIFDRLMIDRNSIPIDKINREVSMSDVETNNSTLIKGSPGSKHPLDPFKDIRGPFLDDFIGNRVQHNSVMGAGIIAYRKDR